MTLPLNIVPKPTLELSHQKIHEGNHFSVHKFTLGVAAIKYFLIIPPPVQPDGSVIEMHLIFEISTNVAGGILEFFENPTITANGTSLDIINNNRRSSTVSLSQVFEGPTVTSDGTSLLQQIGGTATTGTNLGELNRSEEETVLSPSFNYIIKFTPSAATDLTTELNWYDNRPSSPV